MLSLTVTLTILIFSACAYCQTETVCYAPCGCFSDGPPFLLRPLPQSPWDMAIQWELYTRNNSIEPQNMTIPFNGSTVDPPSNFDPSRQTKYLIHGYLGDADDYLLDLKDALLERGDFNLILVDWRGGANEVPLQSASNTRVVGACSAYIARTLLDGDVSSVHCTGHSLGAHSCGMMGEFTDGEMARISGLDPSGPFFEFINDTEVYIDASDAQFVDIIHTNIRGAGSLGYADPIGHVDFYPWKGLDQPGCEEGDNICNHGIVYEYYLTSIREECLFNANPCDSEEDADDCECETCTPDVDCQVMGYDANLYPGRGNYFLRTEAQAPHCETNSPCFRHV